MRVEPLPAASEPLWRERAVAMITRFYPLASGCGALASSRLVGALAGRRSANLWADVVGGAALVPLDDLVGRSLYFTGDLDPKVSWIVDSHVRPGDVALDVGANLGVVSLRLAARVGSSGRVHAFEPNPRMVAYLEATLARNPGLPVSIHPIALGREDATLPLSIPPRNAGQASLVAGALRPGAQTVAVPVRRLTQFAAEIGMDRIDFIKIDAEGFEAEVLAGGAEVIAARRPRVIVIEENAPVVAGALPPSLAMLRDLGYRLQAAPRRWLRPALTDIPADAPAAAHDFVALAG